MSINIITHDASVLRNTTGGRESVQYIVLHYTATPGATAANEVAYFAYNAAAVDASADFFVDDNEIRQYNNMIDSRYSWAVGVDYSGGTAPFHGKCRNSNSVSIEMSCTFSGGVWRISEKTFQNALALTRHLMARYGIPAECVIRHYDVCGKLCPGAYGWIASTGSDADWKRFKSGLSSGEQKSQAAKDANTPSKVIYRVRKSADDAQSQIGAFAVLENAKAFCRRHSGYKVYDTAGRQVYPASEQSRSSKSTDTLAREVIAGKWGNGDERRRRLTQAGYSYDAVQSRVNEIL